MQDIVRVWRVQLGHIIMQGQFYLFPDRDPQIKQHINAASENSAIERMKHVKVPCLKNMRFQALEFSRIGIRREQVVIHSYD